MASSLKLACFLKVVRFFQSGRADEKWEKWERICAPQDTLSKTNFGKTFGYVFANKRDNCQTLRPITTLYHRSQCGANKIAFVIRNWRYLLCIQPACFPFPCGTSDASNNHYQLKFYFNSYHILFLYFWADNPQYEQVSSHLCQQ